MQVKLANASKLLTWNRSMLAALGIWPKENQNLRFALSYVYIALHLGLECADLVYYIGSLEHVLANLSESITYTMTVIKLTLFRNNRLLGELFDAMKADYRTDRYRNANEVRIFMKYNSIAKIYYKFAVPLIFTTAVLYFLRPLTGHEFARNVNGTTTYVLPFQMLLFYEVTELRTYVVTYLYQSISLYVVTCGLVGTDGLMVSLTLHVCGQLSILAERITVLRKATKSKRRAMIREIVERHLHLISMAKAIDKAFTISLLGQLLGSGMLICVNGYNVLTNSEGAQITTFILYEASMMTILFAYCFIGEFLVQESNRVHDAFYHCIWYEMPPSQAKEFIICMARSQKPLQLTAGKFYVFSLENFTNIIKTSMAYLSMLRTLL